MKKLLYKVILFLSVVLVLAVAAEVVIWFNYGKQASALESWHTMGGVDADILFVGNSRTRVHIDNEAVGECYQKKAYNITQEGYNLDIFVAKIIKYLEGNKKPELIICQVDPVCFRPSTDFYSRSSLIKYIFLDREHINYSLQPLSGYNKFEAYIPLLRYKGLPGMLLRHLRGYDIPLKDKAAFQPQDQQWAPGRIPEDIMTFDMSAFKEVSKLDSICEANDIRLIFHYPPVHKRLYDMQTNYGQFIDSINKLGVTFYDWNTRKDWDDTSLMYNYIHLNKAGAAVLTDMLCTDSTFRTLVAGVVR
jgi:hypothetical protein